MAYLDEIKKLRVAGKHHTGQAATQKARQTQSVGREDRHNGSKVF